VEGSAKAAWEIYGQLEARSRQKRRSNYPCGRISVHAPGGVRSTVTGLRSAAASAFSPARHRARLREPCRSPCLAGRELSWTRNVRIQLRSGMAKVFSLTRAHNTVTIDDRTRPNRAGPFTGNRTPLPGGAGGRFTWMSMGGGTRRVSADASTDGPSPPPPVCPAGIVVVVDDFRGSASHRFDFHYHFAATLRSRGRDRTSSAFWYVHDRSARAA